jgi:hypothetical protein
VTGADGATETETSPDADADAEAARSTREETIERLDAVIDYAEYKSLGDGRIVDAENERIRIKFLNTIVSAANAKRAMLRDKDLDELAERIDQLEEREARAKYR